MSTSTEKIVKILVKTLAKKNNLDYSKLKDQSKKIIKFAKEFLIHDSGEAMAPLINKPKISHQFAAYLH
jgi:hypothetical protein